MSNRFIDHNAAEACSIASAVFSGDLADCADSLRQISADLTSVWHGVSADAAKSDLVEIVQRLLATHEQAHIAGRTIARGDERARNDEREADRRDEEEATRRAAEAAERAAELGGNASSQPSL